jgi:hypothetical protein
MKNDQLPPFGNRMCDNLTAKEKGWSGNVIVAALSAPENTPSARSRDELKYGKSSITTMHEN